MLNIVSEFLLKFRVEPKYFDESRHVYALEIAVGEGSHVTRGFDDNITAYCPAGCAAAIIAVLQVKADVTAY